jgi:iron complex outermembrane receptor protein
MRIIVLLVALLVASSARADPALDAQARKLYQAGMARFQAEEYEVAIQLWQRGFKLKPAPEFLYNIAQAYRLSSERAAVYLEKYLNRYPNAPNREDVLRQIALIKKQAAELHAADAAAKSEPPAPPKKEPVAAVKSEPVAAATCSCAPLPAKIASPPRPVLMPVTLKSAPKKPSEAAPAVAPAALVAPAAEVASHDEPAPLSKKKWFWATLGATAAVVAVGVGVGVGVGTHSSDPVASFGVARGN